MLRITAAWIFAALLIPALLFSQGGYGRRTRGVNTTNPGGYSGPAVTFQGHLKALTKSELRIDLDPDGQSVTFRVSKKTHFQKDGNDIKPADVALETIVAVDAVRDPDQKFSAVKVIVAPPKPKTEEGK